MREVGGCSFDHEMRETLAHMLRHGFENVWGDALLTPTDKCNQDKRNRSLGASAGDADDYARSCISHQKAQSQVARAFANQSAEINGAFEACELKCFPACTAHGALLQVLPTAIADTHVIACGKYIDGGSLQASN